jgi:hypothetical protein
MDLFSEYNYDYLRSPKTNYSADAPVKEIFWIWREICSAILSMNGVPLLKLIK